MAKALIFWTEEEKWSIISLKSVEEPRKDLQAYGVEFVRATYPGFKGKTFPGLIVAVADERDVLVETGALLDKAVSNSQTLRGALRTMGILVDHLDERADNALASSVVGPVHGKTTRSESDEDSELDEMPKVQQSKKKQRKGSAPAATPALQQSQKKQKDAAQAKLKRNKDEKAGQTEKAKQIESHRTMLREIENFVQESPAPLDDDDCFTSDVVGDLTISPPKYTLLTTQPHGTQQPYCISRPLPLKPRPTVAMKAPRSTATAPVHCGQDCSSEKERLGKMLDEKNSVITVLKEEILQLKARVRDLEQDLVGKFAADEVEDGDSRPRPGRHSAATAAAHNMVELMPGSGVYLYDTHIIQARKKKGEAIARHLLSVFYTTNELIEAGNLSGANGKRGLSKEVVTAIVAFTVMTSPSTSTSQAKIALRSKLTAAISKAKPR